MKNPLMDALNIASNFDIITPLVAFIQDFVNGNPAHFGVQPCPASLPLRNIRRLLNTHGVKVWGLMLSTDAQVVMFTVPKSQARWTHHLLQRDGVPILYAPNEAIKQ